MILPFQTIHMRAAKLELTTVFAAWGRIHKSGRPHEYNGIVHMQHKSERKCVRRTCCSTGCASAARWHRRACEWVYFTCEILSP